MDAQTVVILFAASAQTAIMVGVFFRLGGITEGVNGLGKRVDQLEQKG
ncbi:hypothetical protein L6172_09900 [Thalassospiraceae bacterium SW-3-3]|nr:hypothetical protein L6172_09900 [Thalassospiraceae bacterium SW-3-3]